MQFFGSESIFEKPGKYFFISLTGVGVNTYSKH